MHIYYQQSGKRGEEDFSKTLCDPNGELRAFSLNELEDRGAIISPEQRRHVKDAGKFQLWGVPSGARHILRNLAIGDLFLLIGQLSPHALEYARFYFAGEVCFVLNEHQPILSKNLWGDGSFPIIFGLHGNLVDYSWMQFSQDFGYSPKYYLPGQTMRVKPERMPTSPYGNAAQFAHALGIWDDFSRAVEFNGPGFEEGGKSLHNHLRTERSAALVAAFKASLPSLACSICQFDFGASYGELGVGFIEAHHIEPLHAAGIRTSSIEDLIAVCSNCHRMLHRGWPLTTPDDLRARLSTYLGGSALMSPTTTAPSPE